MKKTGKKAFFKQMSLHSLIIIVTVPQWFNLALYICLYIYWNWEEGRINTAKIDFAQVITQNYF